MRGMVIDFEHVLLTVHAWKIDDTVLAVQPIDPREAKVHIQVITNTPEPGMLQLLDDERDVLPRAVIAFVTDPFTDDLVSCPTSRWHIYLQGYDTLPSRPHVGYYTEMKNLPEKELLECHWKDMDPFLGGIGASTT